jgi:cell wall-associated NlpC family hydrolase
VVDGPLAANTARETVADAEQSTMNEPGKCLQWAREQAGIPTGAATAATAWESADVKRRGDPTPPPGAAVYWIGGSHGYGHVAISVGNGQVRSSDAGGTGQVATVPVGWITKNWDLRYAGWSNSINGYTIPGLSPRRD